MKPRVSREDAWRAFASSHGGEIVTRRGGKVKELRFTHRDWTVVFDIYVVSTGNSSATYTRARALAAFRMPFRFSIVRENAFYRFGKLLGMQDIHVGNPEVDRRFMIRTDNESMIRSVLIDPAVYRLLLDQKAPEFSLAKFRGRRASPDASVAVLRYMVHTTERDTGRLTSILELMKATLDSLARVGAISAATPQASL